MKATDIGLVLVRLWAVFVVVIAANNLGEYSAYFVGPEGAILLQLSVFSLTFVVPCLLAATLWFYPSVVIGDSSNQNESSNVEGVDAKIVMSIGLTVVGVYVLISGITQFTYNEAVQISQNAYAASVGIDRPDIVPGFYASRLTSLVEIVLGLILILGRHGFSRILMKIKYGGVSSS